MIFADTHTHLYLDAFDDDRTDTVKRAIDKGVKYIFLPHIDSQTTDALFALSAAFPENCFPMAGLHPTSVKENYRDELDHVARLLETRKVFGVGEIGIDLYWDTTYRKQQEEALRIQFDMALKYKLPVVIHTRNSFSEVLAVLKDYKSRGLRGVFHCFSGDYQNAKKAMDFGFYLGIGGVLTFKNSKLKEVVAKTGPEPLLLETDAPFLAPVPYRGKRSESGYIPIIATHLAQATGHTTEEIAAMTTANALKLFQMEEL
ncbi:MAG: TatD family hydrolase [Bacteroidales bacterium]